MAHTGLTSSYILRPPGTATSRGGADDGASYTTKLTSPISEREFAKLHKEGLLESEDIECQFNGTVPVKCWRIIHDFTTLNFNEPPKCPELEKPYARSNLSPHQSVIYDVPVKCWRIIHDFTTLNFNEPPKCPELKKPYARSNLSPHQSVIYDACYAYSRLGSKCLVSETNKDVYYRDDCQRFRSDVKISDGEPAKFKEFPHLALTGCRKDPTKDITWIGVGSLISEYFILTAAHSAGNRDIVKFSDFIRPACLTFPGSKEYEYTACTVAGWGYMGMGERQGTSDVLRKATVYQEYNHNECTKSLLARYFDSTTMICIRSGEALPNQDTCQDQSGVHLMTMSNKYVRCSYFVAGVASWGPRCGLSFMAAYTNVSYDKYQEWIVENVWPLQLNAKKINLK
ncbi:Coagulation factor XI [Papilio machaon]|uniref:Coagulation factor XI n=1 Tax=Papilio machaon TaxID=76193 RepID=A0A194RAB0_PAPMA|nr:Coagulation factor XI [Papilio machaon]